MTHDLFTHAGAPDTPIVRPAAPPVVDPDALPIARALLAAPDLRAALLARIDAGYLGRAGNGHAITVAGMGAVGEGPTHEAAVRAWCAEVLA